MNNKKVRALICSLAAVMVLGFVPTCLTGCGSSSDDTKVESSKSDSKKTTKKADKKTEEKLTDEKVTAFIDAYKAVAAEQSLEDLSANENFANVPAQMKAAGAKDYAVYGKLASGLSCQVIVADEDISKAFLSQFKDTYKLTEAEKTETSTILSGEISGAKSYVASGKNYLIITMGVNEEEVKNVSNAVNAKLSAL